MRLEKVTITSVKYGGLTINGTLVLPEKLRPKNPAVLFIHGWNSSEVGYIPRAEALADLGYISLTFNLPGHGTSGGDLKKLTGQDYLNGAALAYDYLKSNTNVDSNKISVVGASFGGYLGIILTKRKPVSSLVLRAPANYPDAGFDNLPQFEYSDNYKQLGGKEFNYPDTISLRTLHNYSGDMLIVESERDEEVRHQTIESYMNAATNVFKLVHRVIKGADHKLGSDKYRQEFIEILKEWFDSRL